MKYSGLPLGVLEGEDGGQHAVAVAADLQRVADGVDADDEVLDVGVAQDHPAVAELSSLVSIVVPVSSPVPRRTSSISATIGSKSPVASGWKTIAGDAARA